jgi:hypothetical protein
MQTKCFNLSNQEQRDFTKIRNKITWIIDSSDNYREAYTKISKLRYLDGTKIQSKNIKSMLSNKRVLNRNPKLKKK